jgi:hypothetical protein
MRTVLLLLICPIPIAGCVVKPACPFEDGRGNCVSVQDTYDAEIRLVDSLEEILYLKMGLNSATVSEDRKLLYNFNNDLNRLEVIDLENLSFQETHPFEKEGPDGTGRFIQTAFMVDSENILLNDFQQSGVFDKTGRKTRNINLRYTDYEGELPGRGETLSTPVMMKAMPDHLYGLYKDFQFNSLFLGNLNLEQKNFNKIALPEFAYLKDYFIQLIGANGFPEAFLSPTVYNQNVGNNLILSNTVSSDLYIYNSETDSLNFITINHTLFPSRKTGKYQTKVESMEAFERQNQEWGGEINFRAPIWNEDKNVFYRFATTNTWKEVDGKPKIVGADVFFIVMDQDFNVLVEQKVEQLTKNPGYHFLKDGKIWFFENMEDEMGFIRLSLN